MDHMESHSDVHSHSIESTRKRASRRLKISWVLTLILFTAEFVGGLISNSLALLSDAGHMLGDLAALALSLFSIFWASRKSKRKTFGYHRAEVLATFLNGAFLAYVAFQILWEASQRIASPEKIELSVMFPIAFAGLLVNVIAAFLLHGFDKHMVTRSAFLHVVSDALSSVAVLSAGAVIYFTGWMLVDPLISVLISLMILRNAYLLLHEAYDVLMEGIPHGVEIGEVRKTILALNEISDVHDLHVWTIGSGFFAASAHVIVQNMQIRESERIVSEISKVLREKFSINHTTIQVAAAQEPAKLQKLS
jgi:cobalt-zinc-cadmium efflux system protein